MLLDRRDNDTLFAHAAVRGVPPHSHGPGRLAAIHYNTVFMYST